MSRAKAIITISAEDKTARAMKALESRSKKIGRSLKSIGKTATIGTAAITAGFFSSLKAYDAQEKALAQVKAGIEATGNAAKISFGDLQKEAAALQKTSLFGDEDILKNVTSQLQTFTNIAGTQFKRTQAVALDLATKLDGDLKSASIQLGKALNDPVANLSALSRSGIQFTKEQKGVIKGLAESGKLAEAQSLILEELERQYGGAAQAAAEAGLGPLKQIQNRIGDFSERIGKSLLPALKPLGDIFDKVVTKLEGMDDGMVAVGVAIAAGAAAIGPLLIALGVALPAITAIGTALGAVTFAPIIAGVALVGTAFFVLVKYWDQVKAGAQGLVSFVVSAFESWKARNAETISSITETLSTISENSQRIFNALVGHVQTGIEAVDSFLEPIGGLSGAWEALKETVNLVWDGITSIIGTAFDGISLIFGEIADILEGNKTVWQSLKDVIGGAWTGIKTIVKSGADAIVSIFSSIDLLQVGRDIINGLAKGIKEAAANAIGVSEEAADGILLGVKTAMGIRSPSREMAKLGKFAMAGLAVGIVEASPMAERAAEESAAKTLAAFEANAAKKQPSNIYGAQGGFGDPTTDPSNPFAGGGAAFGGDEFGGGFGPALPIPGEEEVEKLRSYYDQRLALLQEKGLEETELAKAIELQKTEALAGIRQTQIAGYASGFSAIGELTKAFGGEQSGAYKALFAVTKGFAVAESILAIQTSIAKATAIGFPANVPLIAQAISQGAKIVSTIKGTSPSFEGGGFTGTGGRTGGVDGKGGFNAVLHPNESVIDHTRGGDGGSNVFNITINGDPNPDVVESIKEAAAGLAIGKMSDINRRGGQPAANLRPA